MSKLQDYIDEKNRWNRITNSRMYPKVSNLLSNDKSDLAESLSADLSPENLTCDGELRGSALAKRAALLNGAVKELRAMGVAIPAW